MIFRVTFADGSAEMVQAGTAGQARIDASSRYPDRIVMKVAPAGLGDMMVRRPPPNFVKR